MQQTALRAGADVLLRSAQGGVTTIPATALAGLLQSLDGAVRLAVIDTCDSCSDGFIRACVALAKEHGVGLHTHVAESKVQAIVGLQRYGKTLTAHLDDLGVLGPNFTVAHSVCLGIPSAS